MVAAMNMIARVDAAETIRVAALTTRAEIEGLAPDWQALGERSFAPAGSHLASWLLPALAQYSARHPPRILAARRGDRLCGVLALKAHDGPVVRSWTSPLSFLGTPLIDQELSQHVMKAFVTALPDRAIRLSDVPATGPFWDMLVRVVAESQGALEVLNRRERAALNPKTTFEEWFAGNFERKRRKEFRRLKARLGEEGKFASLVWAEGDPLDPWIDDLIALEAKGWKGRRGTALAADAAMATAFREALHQLAGEGSLRFWKLVLDDRPIAMMSGLVKDGQGWLGKIAYDEAFARYSPGVMLVLDATQCLIDKDRLTAIDSCAIPDHPMINSIWRDRLALCDVMIKGPRLSSTAFRVLVAAEKGRLEARAAVKALFYRITRRQKS